MKTKLRDSVNSAKWMLFFLSVLFIAFATSYAENITYTYDELNRIIRVDYGGGTVITYTYDAAGNRTTMVSSRSETSSATINVPNDNFNASEGSRISTKAKVADSSKDLYAPSTGSTRFSNGDSPMTIYDYRAQGNGETNDGVYSNAWVVINSTAYASVLQDDGHGLGHMNGDLEGSVIHHSAGERFFYLPSNR